MYITVTEKECTIQSLSVMVDQPGVPSRESDHWLRPFLERRLRGTIALPHERLTLRSHTSFQRKVLHQLDRVPAGQATSYGELASTINRPKAARAVGQALKKNPYPLLLPCHRVVRSDGSIGGYGGTLNSPVKKRLLELETELSSVQS